IQPPTAPRPVELTGPTEVDNAQIAPAEISDVVEISDVARLAAQIQEIPDIRAELVERVKTEIQAGTYEAPERVDIAVSRLMEEFFPGP
ncbi:unnamed protein product, partial [marine sediment metagenome]